MASGNAVGAIINVLPPATLFPQPYIRQGGSTPAERKLVYGFDAAAIEYLDFEVVLLDNYAGGGLSITIEWSAATATTNSVQWGIGIRRIADDADDIDTAHTYDYNEVTDTCASATGETSKAVITFTSGADMDSWAAGETAIVRVRREADDATNDTMAGDAELWSITVRET